MLLHGKQGRVWVGVEDGRGRGSTYLYPSASVELDSGGTGCDGEAQGEGKDLTASLKPLTPRRCLGFLTSPFLHLLHFFNKLKNF